MPTPIPTVEELVETLRRSSLPTVLCEGTLDLTVIRFLEGELGSSSVSLLPCGGRDALLEMYRRKDQYRNTMTAYFADQDTWVFTGIPREYYEIIFTWGYSIENDLLESMVIDKLMTAAERERFSKSVSEVCRWFAFEIAKLDTGGEPQIAIHVDRILNSADDTLSTRFLSEIRFVEPTPQVLETMTREYRRLLRGKTLLQLFIRLLSHPKRESKYSGRNLVEIATKVDQNPRIKNIITRITETLGLSQTENGAKA